MDCPAGWSQLWGKCFYLAPTLAASWYSDEPRLKNVSKYSLKLSKELMFKGTRRAAYAGHLVLIQSLLGSASPMISPSQSIDQFDKKKIETNWTLSNAIISKSSPPGLTQSARRVGW